MKLILLVLLAGCTTRVTVREVHLSFRADERALRPAIATSQDFRPLVMDNERPMGRTIELSERYLAQRERDDLNRDYVAAMLACSYLAQGRTADARKLTLRLVVPPTNAPELERGVIERTKWLAGACHAMQGRLDLEEMIRSGEGVVEFLELYGVMVGYSMPRKYERDYLTHLERYTLDLNSVLFAPEPRSPRQLDARTRRILERSPRQLDARTRRILERRRILSELVYNDAAAFKESLRDPMEPSLDTTDAFFSMALSSLYVTLSYLSDDLVPRVRMEGAQKQWLREQALSTYEAVRELACHYLQEDRMKALETGLLPAKRATPLECRERLYARLFIAQKEVLAWITIRGE
ncbi:MAG: hypothetical protein ACYTEG_01365 [Planctomycetota bacterium]|jgi:hypothetical protein